MENLIKRYICDVTRRLPEKEREEVYKELTSNIYDMLPENADETQIRAVLYQLGAPAALAEKYRQNPRYLISPAIYDDYIRTLKWILTLVGSVVFLISMITGSIAAIKDGVVDISYYFSSIFPKCISIGFAAALQALVWITIGYVIAERVGTNAEGITRKEWKIEDLPELTSNAKNRISLSDSIISLVLTAAFAIIAILVCSGALPIPFLLYPESTEVINLFSQSFLAICIPAIVVVTILSICEYIAKIKDRRWTPLVCGTVITSNLVGMGIFIYLINRSDLFSTEFIAFLQIRDWGIFDLLRSAETGATNPIILFICIIVVVCSLIDCGVALYKTLKNKNEIV